MKSAMSSRIATIPSPLRSDVSALQRQDSSANHIHHTSHPATLLEQMNALRKDKMLTDICLESDDGQQFHCHRIILAATCPYFSAMFSSHMGETSSDKVTLHDIAGSILGQLIDYCYTGSLLLTDDIVNDVAEAANFLQFSAVEEECVRVLQNRLNAMNSLETEQVANRLFNRQLSAQAHGYSVKNFSDVAFTQDFLDFTQEQIEDFISKDVGVDSEEEVYEAVMRWVYHDKDKRKTAIPSLFEKLLFEMMPEAYVLKIAASEPLLQEFDDCMKIVKKAHSFHGAKSRSSERSISSSTELLSRANSMRAYSEVMILIGDLEFCYRMEGCDKKAINMLMYDPKHQKWECLPESPFGLGSSEFATCATVINNDIITVTNWHRAWLYSTSQSKWSLLTNRMQGRNGGCLVTLNNDVFILGGLKPVITSRMTSVQCFNQATKQWVDVAPMTEALLHTTSAACLGKIYVVGGSSGSRYVSEMLCYSPDYNKWISCEPLPSRLMRPQMVVLTGSLYVLGLENDFAMAMYRFDVRNQQWTVMDAPMISRHGATLSVCNNKLFLVGGKICSSDYRETNEFTVEYFDPDSEIWSIHGESQWVLNGHQAVTVLHPAFSPSRYLGPKQH
ncbi:kelch-like protein 21 [Acanthaster planci]|uniref:Kelch-like protein 21 n=1 Tax=Acanthaster planci TaxID=133434 RepID=A0A8B7ZAZ1_ACAPL|nr:kelch-like protein 21 [Acanthaster planci]XP_022102817.1 kelch-like protein 21 [Acanthaster planci]XP_022102818.1 kelch-like protein 21 [Acanthaster planci]